MFYVYYFMYATFFVTILYVALFFDAVHWQGIVFHKLLPSFMGNLTLIYCTLESCEANSESMFNFSKTLNSRFMN